MRLNEDAVVTLPGSRVALLPYDAEFVPLYHAWMECAALREATASERLTLDQEFGMQASWREDADKLTFIVALHGGLDGAAPSPRVIPVGDVNLFFRDGGTEDAEVEAMVAAASARRSGVASTAVALALAYARARLGLRTVVAKIGRANAASRALFESLGFAHTGGSAVFSEDHLTADLASPDARPLAGAAGWAEGSWAAWRAGREVVLE